MKKTFVLLSAMLLQGIVSAQVDESAASKYPKTLEEIPEELRYPVGAKITVDKDGNYVVNGKIRWLLGTQTCKGYCENDILPTPGYPASLKWLYEHILDYETAQKVGFDTVFPYTSTTYYRQLFPNIPYQETPWDRTNQMHASSGLPLAVDFTTNRAGEIRRNKKYNKFLPPEEAFNNFEHTGINHWVYFSTNHPEGQKLMKAVWEEGTKDFTGRRSPVIAYELYNEPALDDRSGKHREDFALWLKEKYGNVETMNRVWKAEYASFEDASKFEVVGSNAGLFVDWGKFMEKCFHDSCVRGVRLIRAIEPDALISMQIGGHALYRQLNRSHINSDLTNSILNVISLPTGGGCGLSGHETESPHTIECIANPLSTGEGIAQRHFYRTIGKGKPVINGELYIGKTAQSMKSVIWQDLLRGCSATYTFEWTKRAWDWKPRNETGGKLRADRAPYAILNPYNKAEIWGIMEAKKEIFKLRDLFMPRERGEKRETALLISYPSERIGEVNGNTARNEVPVYASALEFSHIAYDVVTDEYFVREKPEYKVIFSVGARNITPQAAEELLKFVRKGGTLILAREFMTEDEYGHDSELKKVWNVTFERLENAPRKEIVLSGMKQHPLIPGKITGSMSRRFTSFSGWQVLAESGKEPAVLMRRFGKGKVCLIAPEFQDYPAAALLYGLLEPAGIRPRMTIRNANNQELLPNVELHESFLAGGHACFLLNHDKFPKLAVIEDPSGKSPRADLLGNQLLSGKEVLIPAQGYCALGFGDAAFWEKKFGKFSSPKEKEKAAYDRLCKEWKEKLEASSGNAFRFQTNPARMRTIDLRDYCNRGFTDSVADDGKGGWTDQGRENSLLDVPWGVQNFLGVPCDLIRFDMNNNRTCIVLSSKSQKAKLPEKIEGIRIGGKIRAFYFFHTRAWSDNDPVLTYRLHYASGRTLDIPVLNNRDIGNWWVSHGSGQFHVAWHNRYGRGFQVMEFVNPRHEDDVNSLDILSPCSKVVPVVIALTVEEYVPVRKTAWENMAAGSHGNLSVKVEGKTIRGTISNQTKPWAGLRIFSSDKKKKDLVIPPGKWNSSSLVFDLLPSKDRFGNKVPSWSFKIALFKGKGRYKSIHTPRIARTLNPEVQTVRIPLRRFDKTGSVIRSVSFQLLNEPGAGVTLRNVHFEIPD